ncbi:MAG: 50S ribosomal protein L35ae [archaeon]
MKAMISGYRRGRRTMHGNQLIIEIDGVNSKEKASALMGKKVEWKTTSGKSIKGKISRVHGNNGRVIARFTKGLPGESIGTKVNVSDFRKIKNKKKKEKEGN